MANYGTHYYALSGDPFPEGHPKILNQFSAFRVHVREELREELGEELPIIPMTRNITSKSFREYANNKMVIKTGELIRFRRYEARMNQYIFATDDNVEIVVAEAFINKKFLFPINLSR